MFKFLLEMRSDLSDMKSLIYELIRSNDLTLPDLATLKNKGGYNVESLFEKSYEKTSGSSNVDEFETYDSRPIILKNKQEYKQADEVEEIVSIEEMEKDMIRKALKKFNNRRKDAADELGISERTLYRKIKQYDI